VVAKKPIVSYTTKLCQTDSAIPVIGEKYLICVFVYSDPVLKADRRFVEQTTDPEMKAELEERYQATRLDPYFDGRSGGYYFPLPIAEDRVYMRDDVAQVLGEYRETALKTELDEKLGFVSNQYYGDWAGYPREVIEKNWYPISGTR